MKINYLIRSFILIVSFLISASAFASHNTSGSSSSNASISTDTVNISVGENGSWTISGNDGGSQREFRWSLPSGLTVTAGSSNNMNRFRVRSDRGYFQAETDGGGSFSGTINVSSNNAGTYTMSNTRAEISLSPDNVTITVAGSGGGGGSTPPPDPDPTPEPPPPTSGGSGNADYTLYIERGFHTINGDGGEVINVWGYTSSNGATPMIPGPLIEATQGQSISIEVVNNNNRSHNFVIQGVTSDTGSISPGSSKTYTFTPSKGGVFFYRDTLNSNVNREMGLHGALIVRSNSSNRVWDNGPSYNIERLWVLADMDTPRWNDRASAGNNVSTGSYRPNVFMINGMGGFDGMHDPNTVLEGNSGQVGVVRIVNAGQFDQSLHWHGNHFRVISRNGSHLSNFEWQDTINVKGGETMMVLYQLRGGIFPMHVHTAQMETTNGVYLNGTATLIVGN